MCDLNWNKPTPSNKSPPGIFKLILCIYLSMLCTPFMPALTRIHTQVLFDYYYTLIVVQNKYESESAILGSAIFG